jgi:hypothetical protein
MSFYIKIRLFNPKLTLFCIFLHMDISDIQPPPPVVYIDMSVHIPDI